MKRLRHDPLRIATAPRNKVSDVCFRMLDRVQNEQPEIQVFAVATLYAAMAKRLGVDAGDLFAKATKMLDPEPFDTSGNERFHALVAYARQELPADDLTTI